MASLLLSSLLFLTISNNFSFISQCNFIKHKLDHISFVQKSFSSSYLEQSHLIPHLLISTSASLLGCLCMKVSILLFWLSAHSFHEPSCGWFLNITLSLQSPVCSEKFLFFYLFYISRNFFPSFKRMLFMNRVCPKYQSLITSLVLLIRW